MSFFFFFLFLILKFPLDCVIYFSGNNLNLAVAEEVKKTCINYVILFQRCFSVMYNLMPCDDDSGQEKEEKDYP